MISIYWSFDTDALFPVVVVVFPLFLETCFPLLSYFLAPPPQFVSWGSQFLIHLTASLSSWMGQS